MAPSPASDQAAEGPRLGAAGRRSWTARVLALLALGLAVVAVVAAVASVHTTRGVSEPAAASAMRQLNAADQEVSRQLNALQQGQSPRPAQTANRAANALAKRLESTLGTGGDVGASTHAALTAQLAYADAVGSTINNPRSVLRDKIIPRSRALQAALGEAPGGDPASVTGAAKLVAFSIARAGG